MMPIHRTSIASAQQAGPDADDTPGDSPDDPQKPPWQAVVRSDVTAEEVVADESPMRGTRLVGMSSPAGRWTPIHAERSPKTW